jgi:hypothetical protein
MNGSSMSHEYRQCLDLKEKLRLARLTDDHFHRIRVVRLEERLRAASPLSDAAAEALRQELSSEILEWITGGA